MPSILDDFPRTAHPILRFIPYLSKCVSEMISQNIPKSLLWSVCGSANLPDVKCWFMYLLCRVEFSSVVFRCSLTLKSIWEACRLILLQHLWFFNASVPPPIYNFMTSSSGWRLKQFGFVQKSATSTISHAAAEAGASETHFDWRWILNLDITEQKNSWTCFLGHFYIQLNTIMFYCKGILAFFFFPKLCFSPKTTFTFWLKE